jgi:hypothetical protein
MAPAMRTCITTEERQANLSEKLARAANLLRTRVDVELEQQNRDLLRSMNERTRLQLRLQTTVEGLSVAAISYYVVGLFGYLVKGAHDEGVPVNVFVRHRVIRAGCRSRHLVGRPPCQAQRYCGGRITAGVKVMRTERLEFTNPKGENLAALMDLAAREAECLRSVRALLHLRQR